MLRSAAFVGCTVGGLLVYCWCTVGVLSTVFLLWCCTVLLLYRCAVILLHCFIVLLLYIVLQYVSLFYCSPIEWSYCVVVVDDDDDDDVGGAGVGNQKQCASTNPGTEMPEAVC